MNDTTATENITLTVSQLLELLGTRIGREAIRVSIAKQSADDNGGYSQSDRLKLQHTALIDARSNIYDAIEHIATYTQLSVQHSEHTSGLVTAEEKSTYQT